MAYILWGIFQMELFLIALTSRQRSVLKTELFMDEFSMWSLGLHCFQ